MQTYGPVVELNPIAQELAKHQGYWAGILYLALTNAATIGTLLYFHRETYLHVYFGAKLALGAMQLKSLQIESMIEKILHKGN